MKDLLRHPLTVPVTAALFVAIVGWWSHSAIQESLSQKLDSELRTVLASDVEALGIWLRSHETYAQSMADREFIRRAMQQLLQVSEGQADPAEALKSAAVQHELAAFLGPKCESHDYPGFALISATGRVLAASKPFYVGRTVQPDVAAVIARILRGASGIVHPHVRAIPEALRATLGRDRMDMMFVAAPIRDERKVPVGILGFEMEPGGHFSDILAIGRVGDTGETYAFDANCLLLSHSRFEKELRSFGLLPPDPAVRAILNVEIRNPGADLTQGFKAKLPMRARPPTRMAASAIMMSEQNANLHRESRVKRRYESDIVGYPDYRGVKVVGAWTWLPMYGFGVATEVDHAEAYHPLRQLEAAFWVLFGTVVACVMGMFFYSWWTSRLRSSMEVALQLGQYTLEEKLGEGGMGKVYKARHAMMRRPVAIKLMSGGGSARDKDRIARFEREVVLTSQLTHPNTIAIYDYGCTPDGIFYYAMEHLEGLDLAELVDHWGALPEGRVIHVLRQVCASLHEAHSVGFVHRDIKPANVILCERGGISDMVKVLDFGLVKDFASTDRTEVTAAGLVTGTPDYLAPEVLQDPKSAGPQSDIYAVGVVAFQLLTGEVVFPGESVMEVVRAHIDQKPRLPSEVRGSAISSDLEQLVMQMLHKNPDARPRSAQEIIEGLDACESASAWGPRESARWWEKYAGDIASLRTASRSTPTGVGTGVIDKTLSIDPRAR